MHFNLRIRNLWFPSDYLQPLADKLFLSCIWWRQSFSSMDNIIIKNLSGYIAQVLASFPREEAKYPQSMMFASKWCGMYIYFGDFTKFCGQGQSLIVELNVH